MHCPWQLKKEQLSYKGDGNLQLFNKGLVNIASRVVLVAVAAIDKAAVNVALVAEVPSTVSTGIALGS